MRKNLIDSLLKTKYNMSDFLRKLLMAYMNKICRFIENTLKMTFLKKIKTFCVKIILLL